MACDRTLFHMFRVFDACLSADKRLLPPGVFVKYVLDASEEVQNAGTAQSIEDL